MSKKSYQTAANNNDLNMFTSSRTQGGGGTYYQGDSYH
jgi:hypothetical protein